eukprot:GGOE01045039.1.p3 GENE.GGOE01045039.1~~GGOE01045039.1.p3  ORF type:complete len:144 (-),score=13.41 GGOE01045039.1:29-460(-)
MTWSHVGPPNKPFHHAMLCTYRRTDRAVSPSLVLPLRPLLPPSSHRPVGIVSMPCSSSDPDTYAQHMISFVPLMACLSPPTPLPNFMYLPVSRSGGQLWDSSNSFSSWEADVPSTSGKRLATPHVVSLLSFPPSFFFAVHPAH